MFEKYEKLSKDYVRNSVSDYSEFPDALRNYAESLGYDLCISNFSGHIVLSRMFYDSPIRRTSRADSTLPYKDYTLTSKKALVFSGRIVGEIYDLDGNYVSFHDFADKFVRGLNVGCGGGGRGFSYEIRLYVEDFPKILEGYKEILPLDESYIEYLRMEEGYARYSAEKEALVRNYEEEYLRLVKISDIEWAILNQDLKDIREEIRILSEKRNLKLKEIRKREGELDIGSVREARTIPIKNRSFDIDRYRVLRDAYKNH